MQQTFKYSVEMSLGCDGGVVGGSGLRTMLAEAFASYRSRGLTTPKWRSNRVVRHVAEQPSATVATVQPHCQPDAKLMGVRRGMATTNASERKLTDRLAQPHGRFIMPKGRYLLQASGLTSTCRASNSRFGRREALDPGRPVP